MRRGIGMDDRGEQQRSDSSPLRALSDPECWRLLSSHDLGRVALLVDDWPQVFPVNYAAGEQSVVFRSAAGAKAKYGPGSRACFEIDGWDDRTGTGWSVMVQGLIRDITEATDKQAEELRRLPLHPAAPGVRDHLLALTASQVSGRRFGGPGIVRPLPF
jgi:nitroimidazol reductase NimA-like FMN-containing flavoprotein (pyridoxamine 5'-phosphate oxidase superfamily)